MGSLYDDVREDFNLFHDDYIEYQKKVDNVSKLFNLKNKAKLRNDYCPTYFEGNFEDNNYKYVIVGINPGFSEKQNPKEEALKSKSWDEYLLFIKNFFKFFKNNKMKSFYYRRLSKLFSGLDVNYKKYPGFWDYYHDHLINFDLIPYHSNQFGISNSLTDEQKEYLKERVKSTLNFIKELNEVRLILIHGKLSYLLFIENNLIPLENKKPFKLNEKINFYRFNLDGIPCVLFDKFITQPAFGLKTCDLEEKIPRLLNGC